MEAISNQTCLYRSKTAYYFRKSIPSYARPILGMTECKKSFKNNDYLKAKKKAAHLNRYLEQLFIMIKDKKPDNEEIIKLIQIYFEKLLIDAEGDIWLDAEAWQEEYGIDIKNKHDGKTPQERISDLEEAYAQLKLKSINQDYKIRYRESAKQLMNWQGFTYFEISSQSEQLRRGMLSAELEALRIELAMRKGQEHETAIQHPLLKDCRNFILNPNIDLLINNEGLPYYADEHQSHSLQDVVKKYISFIEQKNYAGNTLSEIESVLTALSKTLGEDKKIKNITIEECRQFRNLVQHYPAYYMKKYGNKGISIQEVVNSGTDYQKLSPRSRDKYWTWVNSFFSWCVDELYLETNLLKTLKVQPVKASSEDRATFTNEELQKLFTSPQYLGHKSPSNRHKAGTTLIKDGKYWIPLVALYTGMRLAEIISLEIGDIKQDDGIEYIDINENSEHKSLKTEQSTRQIPVHPELKKLGFLSFVETRKKTCSSNTRIFNDIEIPNKGGVSLNFSKYFSRYLTKIHIKHKKLVFHSFRHNFVQGMREARIITERMDALDGRNTGYKNGSHTRKNYGRAFKPKDLYEDIAQIKYDVDLSHLYD